MKKLVSLTLSLALAASLAAPAFAESTTLDIAANTSDPAATVTITDLTVNGVKVDASGIPAVAAGYIPGRLLAESDHGSAYWSKEENTGTFYMDSLQIAVDFADNSISVEGEKTDASAIVTQGVTFLPLSVFEGAEGYSVTVLEGNGFSFTTPNNAPLVKLGYDIIAATDAACRMKSDAKSFLANFELDYDKNFADSIIFNGMNINADTLFLGQLKEGADVDAIKAALERFRKSQEDTFSWYLSQNLPKVQAAKPVVVGDYVLFLIADEADKGETLFNTWVAQQK